MKALTKRTVLVAMLLVLLTLTSVVLMSCGGGGDIELAAPKNITYDGAIIRWDAVEGAEGYYITVDGQEWNTTEPVHTHATAESAEFSVSVKAWASDKRNETIVGAVTTVNFKPLATITDLTVTDEGTLTWSPVDFATGYEVRVDGKEIIKVAACELIDLKEGNHNYAVRPVVDAAGGTLYYSRWSTAKAVNKLATVKVDKIAYKDGDITWGQVNGAVSYQVIIDGVEVAAAHVGTRYTFDAENQNFEVQIRANGNGTSTYNGKPCEIKRFVYLDPVTNIRVVDGVLLWDAVGGADGYTVRVNGTDVTVGNTCAYSNLVAGINNQIQIIPTATDSVYFSSWTPAQNVKILSKPLLQWNNEYALDGQASTNCFWDAVSGAGGYVVRITRPDGSTKDTPLAQNARGFEEAFLDAGIYLVTLQAVPSSTTTDVYSSQFSTPIEVVRLSTPKPADQNYITSDPNKLSLGFTVNFQGVQSATTYVLYKDGGEVVMTQNSPMFRVPVDKFAGSNITQEAQFNFYVRAKGNSNLTNGRVVLDSLTETATSFKITVLATPQNMAMDGFNLKFGSVAGSSGYNVTVNSSAQGFMSSSTTFDLGAELEAGTYSVSVCAKGNGTDVLASNFAAPLTIRRLAAPTDIRIGVTGQEEGKIQFTPVSGAKSYTVVFKNEDEKAYTVSELSNVNQFITETGTTVYMIAVANEYSTDDSVYYMTSKSSDTANFMKLAAPDWPEAITNNTQILWNAPWNAQVNSFSPNYRVANGDGIVYNGEFSGTSMILPASYAGGMYYSFKVQAIGDGVKFINSDYSSVKTIYKVETPTVTINATRDGYTWRSVDNAQFYQVWIDGVLVKTEQHTGGAVYTFKPGFKQIGHFQVQVIAINQDKGHYMDSSPNQFVQTVGKLDAPEFTFGYSHTDGYNVSGTINVTVTKASPYALGYIFDIGGTTHTAVGQDFYQLNPGGAGVYKIGVTALGGGFDEQGVYYVNSDKVGGNERYQLTILGSVNVQDININQDGRLEWRYSQSGAQGYEVDIVVNGTVIPTVTIVGGGSQGFNIRNYYPDYVLTMNVIVSIKVKGNGNNIISSTVTTTGFPR